MTCRIGVLALQGAFSEHVVVLSKIPAVECVVEIRKPADMASVDGIILPGGESTTISMLAERSGLLEPLREWVRSGKPVWGTCAGLILLSNGILAGKQGGQLQIGGLDVTVKRNAFGTQLDSFQANLTIPVLGNEAFPGVFIRAPLVDVVHPGVEVLATLDPATVGRDGVVAVRQGHILGPKRAVAASSPDDKLIQDGVTALVMQSIPGLGSERHARKRKAVIDYSLRLLTSRISSPAARDTAQLSDTIKKILVIRNGDTSSAVKFSNLHAKLTSISVLKRSDNILHLLLHLCYNHTPINDASLKPIFVARQNPPRHSIEVFENSAKSLDFDIVERPKMFHNYYSSLWSTNTSEADILRDLIFVLQGIDAKMIKRDRTSGHFQPTLENIPGPTQELIFRISELGFLYAKVLNVVTQNKKETSGLGLVHQSFCVGLHDVLIEYMKTVSDVENYINMNDSSSVVTNGLSLKRLFIWTLDSLSQLRLLCTLLDMCEGLKGGALLSVLYHYLNHGDPGVQELVQRLLKKASSPFFKQLIRWTYDGELEDPFTEFFVISEKNADADNLWRGQYVLRSEFVPGFLDKATAKKSYVLGKSLNFIRRGCDDEEYVRRKSAEGRRQGDVIFGSHSELLDRISRSYTQSSGFLLELLFERYKLLDHFLALRRFLMLGQGDFIQILMDKLGPDLDKPADIIFRHNLNGVLEAALRFLGPIAADADVVRRLDVRLLEISSGDTGWDVFTLDYHVEAPLNTIFTPPVMHVYLKIFHFLWRLKRIQHLLSSGFKRQGIEVRQLKTSRNNMDLTRIRTLVHRCHAAVGAMSHFIYQLQCYILFEVLDLSWQDLSEYLRKKDGDLDQLLSAHTDYLNKIVAKGLFGGGSSHIFMKISHLFDTILQFRRNQDQLHQLLIRMCGGIEGLESSDEPVPSLDDCESSTRECMEEYRSQMLELLQQFQTSDFMGLFVRLNYNEFYVTA